MSRLTPAALHRCYRGWLAEALPRPSDWRFVAVACAAGLLGWWWAHGTAFWGLQSGDAHSYVIEARRIADGEGFTTPLIFPAELEFGASEDHPSLRRAPVWPLVIAAGFRLAGPEPWVPHVALLLLFVGTVAAGTLLATTLAGRWIGLLVGLAVATSPQLGLYTLDAVSEVPFAFSVTLVFLLLARQTHGLAIGTACALAYLTRYNGALLLPVALAVIAARRQPLRPLAWCALGFAAVASPWWIRNALVAGSPFFSLYDLAFQFPAVDVDRVMRVGSLLHTTPWYELEPRRGDAGELVAKLRLQLPGLLRRFPLASANLAAFAGVLLACARRDALAWALALVAAGTTALAALTVPNGRYLVPLLPAMLAIGASGLARYGGRLRAPALALVLAAPFLPAIPRETTDLHLQRALAGLLRAGEGEEAPPPAALVRCLAGRPLVVADDAPRLAWQVDALVIPTPASRRDFWLVVQRFPVRYARLQRFAMVSREDLERAFRPRSDCAPDLFERRAEAGAPPSPAPR